MQQLAILQNSGKIGFRFLKHLKNIKKNERKKYKKVLSKTKKFPRLNFFLANYDFEKNSANDKLFFVFCELQADFVTRTLSLIFLFSFVFFYCSVKKLT